MRTRLLGLGLALLGSSALATTTVNLGPASIKINGFLTAGYAQSNARTDAGGYLGITKQGSFNDISVAGLQFTMPLGEKFSATTQLLADGHDAEKFDVRAAWAYLKYDATPDFSIKVGRVRTPMFMLSQFLNVGYAYNFAEPPEEVYQVAPVPNVAGITADYKHTFSNGWYIETQPIFASSKEDLHVGGANIETTFHDFYGASIAVGNDWLELRGVMSTGKATFASPATLVSITGVGSLILPALNNVTSNYWGLGLQVDKYNIHFLSEYGARNLRNTAYGGSYGWYANLGYQMGKFIPNITYAIHRSTHKADVSRAINQGIVGVLPAAQQLAILQAAIFEDQNSWTAGLRYNVNSHVALKADLQWVHLLNGTKGMFTQNPGRNDVGIGYLAVNVVF